MSDAPHIPVLLEEVVDALAIAPGEVHVDATFGAGGYTRAMLARGARVFAFDRDPDAIAAGEALVRDADGALTLVPATFSALDAELTAREVVPVQGVTMDIGVSSMQLDQAERGFSFQSDGPLDMRMSQEGESAADFVNEADEGRIADVLKTYGEEPRAKRVARAIVAARPITRTSELAHVDADLPGDSYSHQSRAGRAGRRVGGGRACTRSWRALGGGDLSQPGRSHGQAFPARALGRAAIGIAALAGSGGEARSELRTGRARGSRQ